MNIILIYWRLILELVVALVLVGLVLWHKDEAEDLGAELTVVSAQLRDANSKLEDLHLEGQALMSRLNKAQEEAAKVKVIYKDRIVKITEQKVPETCSDAIDFAIEHKDDLLWPR